MSLEDSSEMFECLDAQEWRVTVAHLCCWGIRITTVCLAVALKIINTAKLLQLIRITNVDGRYSSPNGTNAMLCAVLSNSSKIFHKTFEKRSFTIDHFHVEIAVTLRRMIALYILIVI